MLPVEIKKENPKGKAVDLRHEIWINVDHPDFKFSLREDVACPEPFDLMSLFNNKSAPTILKS